MFRSLVLMVSLFAAARAFGTGAPVDVCQDFTPQHPADPQDIDSSPYLISTDKVQINPGDQVKVTLEGTDDKKFKGFLVQARQGNNIVGSFKIKSTDEEVQLLDCPSGTQNAATHTNPKEKAKITLTWIAPKDLHGAVVFKATFVKDALTFWVGQTSASVTIRH